MDDCLIMKEFYEKFLRNNNYKDYIINIDSRYRGIFFDFILLKSRDIKISIPIREFKKVNSHSWDNVVKTYIEKKKNKLEKQLKKIEEEKKVEEEFLQKKEDQLEQMKPHLKLLPTDICIYILSFVEETKETMTEKLLKISLTKLIDILGNKKIRMTNIKCTRIPLQKRKDSLITSILKHYKQEEYQKIIEYILEK